MRILLIHNAYARFSGEEAVVRDIENLLTQRGHEVICYFRSSAEIGDSVLRKAMAFAGGAYNPLSRRVLRTILQHVKPDVANVHNLFPLISASILPELRLQRIPVVMTVHNYRLVCPNGLHLSGGTVCERCLGGREHWCLIKDCAGGPAKSVGYALRNYICRRTGLFRENVTMYAPLTTFAKQRLIRAGIPEDRITTIPNMCPTVSSVHEYARRETVGFVGRISHEKGIQTFLNAARRCPALHFEIVGDYSMMPELPKLAPGNCVFLGYRSPMDLDDIYGRLRMLIFPSVWFEGFPMVMLEAMLHGVPIICSRIGGLCDIVQENVTGLLFEPGNAQELAEKITYLNARPALCKEYGRNGRQKALQEYSPERYYERLMDAFEKALSFGPGGYQ